MVRGGFQRTRKAQSRNNSCLNIYREGAARDLMDEREFETAMKWQNMSFWDKVGDWSYRHQYTLIMGGWATSLSVAAAIISRNKYVGFILRMWKFTNCGFEGIRHILKKLYKLVCGHRD
jgi:hypothetical protein